jgi:hypothetical protein
MGGLGRHEGKHRAQFVLDAGERAGPVRRHEILQSHSGERLERSRVSPGFKLK